MAADGDGAAGEAAGVADAGGELLAVAAEVGGVGGVADVIALYPSWGTRHIRVRRRNFYYCCARLLGVGETPIAYSRRTKAIR